MNLSQREERESVTLLNDNEKIFGVLHKPILSEKEKGQRKIPAIIVCHGFAGQKTGRYRLYVVLAEELAKNGIAVLRFDFRGCGDSEGDFLKTTLSGEVADALIALEFLRNDADIDSNRLGIFGRSLGGAIAILAAKAFKTVKSIALFAPMFTADAWREKWEGLKGSQEVMVVDGQPVGNDFLQQLFALQLGTDLKELKSVPFLHVNAEKDTVVTHAHKEMYQLSRKGAEATSQFISLPNSDHDFSDVKERMQACQETVAWFLRTL